MKTATPQKKKRAITRQDWIQSTVLWMCSSRETVKIRAGGCWGRWWRRRKARVNIGRKRLSSSINHANNVYLKYLSALHIKTELYIYRHSRLHLHVVTLKSPTHMCETVWNCQDFYFHCAAFIYKSKNDTFIKIKDPVSFIQAAIHSIKHLCPLLWSTLRVFP